MVLPRVRQHAAGAINSGYFSVPPAAMELLCAVTSAAAQVDDTVRIFKPDLRDEIAGRAGALVRKFEVKIGIPVGHLLKNLTTKVTKGHKRLVIKKTQHNNTRPGARLCPLGLWLNRDCLCLLAFDCPQHIFVSIKFKRGEAAIFGNFFFRTSQAFEISLVDDAKVLLFKMQ